MMNERLNDLHYEDVRNTDHPSILTRHDRYSLFILRLPLVDGERLDVASRRFVLVDDGAYRYDDGADDLMEVSGGIAGVYTLADEQTDGVMRSMERYVKWVGELEERIFSGEIKEFMTEWFELKKDINRIERLMVPAVDAVDGLMRYLGRENPHYVGFHDIREHLERTARFCQLNINKLDGLYDFHTSLLNEKTNRTVYMLAIISAIFLPLNFIVSFFGINTGGLFWADDAKGTLRVVALLGVVAGTIGLLLWVFRSRVFNREES